MVHVARDHLHRGKLGRGVYVRCVLGFCLEGASVDVWSGSLASELGLPLFGSR